MLDQINLKKVVFLDIETVPQKPVFEDLPPKLQELWDKKSVYFRKENETASDVYQRAGIYAEFGKIVCISVGVLVGNSPNFKLKIRSFTGDEKALLSSFAELINGYEKEHDILLCAHNGKEFDFPYIARRMLVNQIELPKALDTGGKKPWEVNHLDTLQMWKFGDYKHYTSLDLLSAIFDIPSPKEDIDGSMVSDVYWKENDIQKIVKYCQNDVLTVVQLVFRFKQFPLLSTKAIEVSL